MEEEDTKQLRYEKLGFKPQKENEYNKLLPYAEVLDEEAIKLLKDIKTNLIKSVLAREIKPGFTLWSYRLNQYLNIYGLMFSKEDHINFIKLFYEVLTLENLEPTRIIRCASTLCELLKKRYLISRDDLELDWKPLYKMCVRVLEKSKTEIGIYKYPANLEGTLTNTIRHCRIYFPASVTQEILDEFKPTLSPLCLTDAVQTFEYLEIFLPICVKTEEVDVSYKLWFDEFMTLWNSCPNANHWENTMMWLMARLSYNNMGQINWDPYIPLMFARFTRTLRLPVCYKQKQSSKMYKIDVNAMSTWIISTLNHQTDVAFAHLEQFLQTLKTYLYSANTGRWTFKIREFLQKIANYFVHRIHCERYKKRSWEKPIPDEFKLSDEDIDRFVIMMRPCLEQAMFSRRPTHEISLTFQSLACLRPHLVVPMIIDKLYLSLDTLTEPHKLISALTAVNGVARYMVQGAKYNYPEGPTHVIPLLMALLPGIDPNDMRKCFATFNFIVQFVNMIPIIDSSGAHNHYNDLTEEEHTICEATAGFEDFVLQFLDRLCLWVESNSLDFIRPEIQHNENNGRNGLEVLAEGAVMGVVPAVIKQCSPQIFNSALRKVFNYVTSNVFEINISGKMVATVCASFARVNAKETLKLFLPHICERIENLLDENKNVHQEEHLDGELMYYLQIFSEILDAKSEIINYLDRIMPILDRTINLTSVEASRLSAHALKTIMLSLTTLQSSEQRSSEADYSLPVKDFFSVREWGKVSEVKNLKLNWYIPKEKEIAVVKQLLNKYLVPSLDKLDQYSAGKISLSREEIRQNLGIIIATLAAHTVLPMWNEPALELMPSVITPRVFNLTVSKDFEVTMPNGSNVRKSIADCMHNLQRRILEIDEGDNKSIFNIINVYNILIFNKLKGIDFEQHWKSFHIIKKLLSNRLLEKKLHLRHVLIDRVTLQQIFRTESRSFTFTNTHKQILLNLFELGICRYSDVRIYSQVKVTSIVNHFPYCYRVLIPKLKETLQLNTAEHHEKFKGCLYTLIGSKTSAMVTKHDWDFIREIWPLILNSMPSEKPSIVNLITAISETVYNNFPTIAIDVNIPDSTVKIVIKLAESEPKPSCDNSEFEALEKTSVANLKRICDTRRSDYNKIVDLTLEACLNSKLHWRHHLMAVGFLRDIVHPDMKYNANVAKYFLNALINESISIRKIALKVTLFILMQNKPEFKKIIFKPERNESQKPGLREDNKWLVYKKDELPTNEKEWNDLKYLNEQGLGLYAWPEEVELYAPPNEQPSIVNDLSTMTDIQKEIYDFFTNENNVSKLIYFLAMEDKKGKDQFNACRYFVFKNLFKILEDKAFNIFLPHLQRLVSQKQESEQRCAAEIIGGLIRGSKHWTFSKIEYMWSELIPILHTANLNILTETANDWSLCIAMALESRDPRKHYWLLEYLMNEPLSDPTSFIACAKLQILSNAINQQTWRNAEIYERILEYLKTHIPHPFQNIRDKISSCLKVIFERDFEFPNGNGSGCPKIQDFFAKMMPTINELYEELLKKVSKDKVENLDQALKLITLDDTAKENSIRVFKIVAKFSTSTLISRVSLTTVPEFYQLLPIACVLQSNDTDDELSPICSNLLALLSQSVLINEHIPAVFAIIKNMTKCPMWSARCALTDFMSPFLFHNMTLIRANNDWLMEMQQLVLELLEDSQPEVRTNAASVLSGLLHCQFLPLPDELLKKFKIKAKTKLKGKSAPSGNNLINRHAGVLGLCAFINSNPYEVPDYLPDIFGQLGPHLSDPQPIPATIRKTLADFKRTHQDNWEEHKLQFTEDELSVLRDLTVPPSYYA